MRWGKVGHSDPAVSRQALAGTYQGLERLRLYGGLASPGEDWSLFAGMLVRARAKCRRVTPPEPGGGSAEDLVVDVVVGMRFPGGDQANLKIFE